MRCRYLVALWTTPTVCCSLAWVYSSLVVVSRDIVKKVNEDIGEFHNQIQYKRVEIPDLWSKVQQYKGTFAISGKLYDGSFHSCLNFGYREQVQKQQTMALELAERKFFIPAARMLMSAIYDARYLNSADLVATTDLCKLLEGNRDVKIENLNS